MKIETIIADKRGEVEKYAREEKFARAEIEEILDAAKREGRSALTASEDMRAEALFTIVERAKTAREKAADQLKRAEEIKAEEDESEKRLDTVTHLERSGRPSNGIYHVASGKVEHELSDDGPAWHRNSDGRPATIARGERFADSEVMRGEIERNAERDRIITGTHGTFAQQIRSMTTSSASAIVPTVWSGEIIDRARNAAVVFQAGATLVPMDAKIVQIGRLTADPAPAFKTEGSPVTAGDLTYDYVQLTATSLTALVVVSLEFLADAPAADQSIMSALGKAMGLEIDKAALFGQLGATGTNDEGAAYGLASPYPKGILKNVTDNNSAGIIGSFPTNGTAQTAATPWTEMLSTVYYPLRQNEKVTAIISNVALKQQYAGMYDSMYNPIRMPDSIAQYPWLTTNAIPSFTRGTMTSRATDVFAGDFSQVLIGQRLGLEIRVLTERYAENGQVGLLAYWRGDVQLARPKAIACYRGLQGAL